MKIEVEVEKGYEPLANVLIQALNQSQYGKGKQCHANGLPFLQQPIMTRAREVGEGGLAFQSMKKILEAFNCKDNSRAVEDMLGAIVYVAAQALLRQEGEQKEDIREPVPVVICDCCGYYHYSDNCPECGCPVEKVDTSRFVCKPILDEGGPSNG
jgi:hypothetical protein